MKFLLGLGLLFSTSCFASANNYKLDMELSLNGKKVAAPHMIVSEGQEGSISEKIDSEESIIDVIATDANKDGSILMNFKISYIGKNGSKKIIGNPSILAVEGKPAKIQMAQTSIEPSELSLTVIVKKVTL